MERKGLINKKNFTINSKDLSNAFDNVNLFFGLSKDYTKIIPKNFQKTGFKIAYGIKLNVFLVLKVITSQ